MKNKNRPFFYEKKRTPFKKALLIFVIVFICLIIIGYQIPRIRQVISAPLFAIRSFTWNSAKDLFARTRMYREPEKKKKTYEPLELPDYDVLFAESLENLSAIVQEDPLADLRQTPTPSEYSKVAAWEYKDPNLNYAITSGGSSLDDAISVKLIPPVFEHADLNNDGSAILSACFRYWNIVENQYQIAAMIHPDPQDPFISFDDIMKYVSTAHNEFMCLLRVNGDKDTLVSLLQRNIPVIVLVLERSGLPQWLQDDHLEGHYFLLLGYDSQSGVFYYQDTARGNTLEIPESELLSEWYPFQRKYLVIYPAELDTEVREALSENYYEELNNQRALVKFRTDSELLPQNAYAQYNYGAMLYEDGDIGGAWSQFEIAAALSLPQRFFIYQSDMMQTALELGFADDLENLAKPILEKNSHDEVVTVYLGWAEVLRGNYKKGSDLFEKGNKINPNSEAVLYALKYRDTMLNY